VFTSQNNIKKERIEKRQYQLNIAQSAKKENTLVVLPTGLGKTIIALFLIAEKIDSNNKILFLSPTKPLVTQHYNFLKDNLDINENEISIFTGEVSPIKRKKIWESSKIIISTPQVIQNDLISKRMDLENVSLIIFDECHHAIGDYAYVFISEIYKKQNQNRHILAITASPGSNIDKIREVCKNLDITNIEIRTKNDPDVKPYVHDLKIKWKEIDLPTGFITIIQLLKKSLSERLKELKKLKIIESASVSSVNKTILLEAQRKIQKEIKTRTNPPKILFKAASVQSESMKIQYALDLIQTQGLNTFLNYFNRMKKESESKKSTRSSKKLIQDFNILDAIAQAKLIDIEHPKIAEIKDIVKNQLKKNKKSKIIIFTHYRDTSQIITNELEKIDGVKPIRFVGQANKINDKGLSQKEQARLIDKFKNKEYNVLIATSVAEEGIDIPSTDLVVFYEPIPSEIRFIQRRGRTARKMSGEVIILITKNSPDQGYYWSAKRKEKRMIKELENIRNILNKKFEDIDKLFDNNINFNKNQKTLSEFNSKNQQLKIIVDQREYRSNVSKILISKGIEIEPGQLEVGDYIISSRLGIERKNVDDYLDSMLNGKLFKQLSRLKNAYSRPMLILEGEDVLTRRNINQNAILGSLASISIDYGIPVITTKDEIETANFIKVLANREQKKEKKSVNIRDGKIQMSPREQQQFLVEGLPNISSTLAKRLLYHFGSIKDITNADMKELIEVKGIGKKTAKEIVDILNKEYLKE